MHWTPSMIWFSNLWSILKILKIVINGQERENYITHLTLTIWQKCWWNISEWENGAFHLFQWFQISFRHHMSGNGGTLPHIGDVNIFTMSMSLKSQWCQYLHHVVKIVFSSSSASAPESAPRRWPKLPQLFLSGSKELCGHLLQQLTPLCRTPLLSRQNPFWGWGSKYIFNV